MPPIHSREVRLASRPSGRPSPENFALATVEVPQPQSGQVLVRNTFMSVDPYMRGRMNDGESYVAPFQLGEAMDGGAVGEVVESAASGLQPGDVVLSHKGWREYFTAPASHVTKVDGLMQPHSAYLGVLGMTGMTAWVGLNLLELKAGESLFVSGAAGAVGSVAGQLARLRGCRVVGSAGSAEKVRILTGEFGFDAAFNYKDGDILGQLRAAMPEGVDAYFDNVGGDHLEAAISALRPHGRVAACGGISNYNAETPPPGPRNMIQIVGKRLTIRGFIVGDWLHQLPAFHAEVGPRFADGSLKMRETVVQGIEHAPQAFLDLFHGENVGKMIVKL